MKNNKKAKKEWFSSLTSYRLFIGIAAIFLIIRGYTATRYVVYQTPSEYSDRKNEISSASTLVPAILKEYAQLKEVDLYKNIINDIYFCNEVGMVISKVDIYDLFDKNTITGHKKNTDKKENPNELKDELNLDNTCPT